LLHQYASINPRLIIMEFNQKPYQSNTQAICGYYTADAARSSSLILDN